MQRLEALFESIKDVKGRSLPPIESWHPQRHAAIDMRILSDGTWLYQGSPINRREMVKLFASILCREEDGSYRLVSPVESLQIQVDDAPFVVLESIRSDSSLLVRTNVDEALMLSEQHKVELHNEIPYVYVRRGLWAKVNRNVYYDWAGQAEQITGANGGVEFWLQSGSYRFRLGVAES